MSNSIKTPSASSVDTSVFNHLIVGKVYVYAIFEVESTKAKKPEVALVLQKYCAKNELKAVFEYGVKTNNGLYKREGVSCQYFYSLKITAATNFKFVDALQKKLTAIKLQKREQEAAVQAKEDSDIDSYLFQKGDYSSIEKNLNFLLAADRSLNDAIKCYTLGLLEEGNNIACTAKQAIENSSDREYSKENLLIVTALTCKAQEILDMIKQASNCLSGQ